MRSLTLSLFHKNAEAESLRWRSDGLSPTFKQEY